MYAILELGGKQYKVEQGSSLLIDLLESKAGQKLSFNSVTLYRTEKEITIGSPYIGNAIVEAKVVEPVVKGEKLTVFKYKAKARYRRKTGHRQQYTKVEVTGIRLGDVEMAKPVKPAAAEKPVKKAPAADKPAKTVAAEKPAVKKAAAPAKAAASEKPAAKPAAKKTTADKPKKAK
jgi:large subunit ribosomal protein L21